MLTLCLSGMIFSPVAKSSPQVTFSLSPFTKSAEPSVTNFTDPKIPQHLLSTDQTVKAEGNQKLCLFELHSNWRDLKVRFDLTGPHSLFLYLYLLTVFVFLSSFKRLDLSRLLPRHLLLSRGQCSDISETRYVLIQKGSIFSVMTEKHFKGTAIGI